MSIVVCPNYNRKDRWVFNERNVRDLAKLSRREKGCIQYDLMAKENGYIVFEEWEDTRIEMHKNSPHFRRLVEAIERDNASFSVNFSENDLLILKTGTSHIFDNVNFHYLIELHDRHSINKD